MNTPKNPAAVALGRLGGIKTGHRYSPEEQEKRRLRLAEARKKIKKVAKCD